LRRRALTADWRVIDVRGVRSDTRDRGSRFRAERIWIGGDGAAGSRGVALNVWCLAARVRAHAEKPCGFNRVMSVPRTVR
jgi:hypothetical protein